jgi:TRAP-type C4-dicarboxylate transport system permease small subunit
MRLLFKSIERTASFAAGCALAASSLAMLAQIVARFVFSSPFVWAEEFAVLMFAWVTFLGAAAVQADDSHLSIDLIRVRAGLRARRILDGLRRTVIVAIAAVLVYQGITLSVKMWMLAFPAMGISRAWLYLSVPVGLGLSLLLALRPRRWWPAATDEAPTTT